MSDPVVIYVSPPRPLLITSEPEAPVIVAGLAQQGPPGRDGAPGGTTFKWHQEIELEVWTVPHNLGRWPSVTVTDEFGEKVLSDVKYIDENIVQITHGRPFSGWAYFN